MLRKPRSGVALLTLALAIGGGVAWLYAPTIDFDFVMFDDDINLYQNPHLGDLTAERIHWAFTDRTYMHRFMPLGWLAWCALLSGGGLDPMVYHTANVVLHALNAVLVFGLVFQLLGLNQARAGDPPAPLRNGLLAALSALVWAMHPLRVEVVAWSSGLLYLQATAWALLAGSLFLTALQATGRRSVIWHPLAILGFALSVATYPVALGWPIALLGVVFLTPDSAGRGVSRAAWITPLAMLVLALIGVLAAVGARFAVTSYWSAPAGMGEYSLAERVTRASFALLSFLWRQVPIGPLTPVTEFFQLGSPARGWMWPSAVLVAVAFGSLLWHRKRWRGVALWAVTFVGVAGPFLGVLDRDFEPADRYTYLPSVVIVGGIAVLVQATCPRSPFGSMASGARVGRPRVDVRRRWTRVFAAIVAGVLIFWLADRTRAQLPVWRDSMSLYTHITAHLQHETARAVYLARQAVFHTRAGEEGAAASRLEQARQWAGDRTDIAPYEQLMDRLRLRAKEASAAPVPPAAVESHSLALQAARGANRSGAEAHFRRALQLAPEYFEARYNFAMYLAVTGRREAAIHQREMLERQGPAFTAELRGRLNESLLGTAPR